MTYVSEVLSDAPLHYWRLADPGGLWAHDIGSVPRPMVIKPDATTQLCGVGYSGPNDDGGSGSFEAPMYMQCEAQLPAFPFTMEVCVWQHYLIAAQAALFTWDASTTLAGISVGGALPGVYTAYRTGGNISGGVPSVWTWDHVAAVYTAAATTLYVNGVQVATAAQTGALSSVGIFLGRLGTAGSQFNVGALSEAAIYGTALSAARIAAHFAAITSRTKRPVSQQIGWDPATGGGTPIPTDLSAVLAAVRKTYTSP